MDHIYKFIKWMNTSEEMLSNGCLPSGHKYAYGMCLICGGYDEWIDLDRSYKDIRIDIEEE